MKEPIGVLLAPTITVRDENALCAAILENILTVYILLKMFILI